MTKTKVLVIDYEPRGVQQLSEPLLAAGYDVAVAHDGLEGFETFRRIRPAVVVVEAMLPKQHGFDLCRRIKTTQDGKVTPVIIVTAVYKGRKYRSQALHHYGCDDYLEKPVDPERLVASVTRFVRDRGAAAPTPAATPEPMPPLAAPAEPTVDETTTDAEIVERLDELLPNAAPKRSDRVVAFDSERARRHPTGPATAAAASPSPSAHPVSAPRAASAAPARRPEPRVEFLPQPYVEPRRSPFVRGVAIGVAFALTVVAAAIALGFAAGIL